MASAAIQQRSLERPAGLLRVSKPAGFRGRNPLDLVLTYGAPFTDPSIAPNPNRQYAYNQAYFFAQDSYQISRRLTLNFGIRYELLRIAFEYRKR